MSNRSTIAALALLVLLASCACLGAFVSWSLNNAMGQAATIAETTEAHTEQTTVQICAGLLNLGSCRTRQSSTATAPPSGDKAGDTEQTAADPWCWREKTQRASILEIKRRVSLLDLLPDARSTSGDARWWMARCPLHDDQHESLWIDNKNGLCGCLAGCTSKPLDVINLYQRLHGCDAAVAVRELVGPVPGQEGGVS